MKQALLFVIFIVCSSLLIKPKKKCDCVTEMRVYKNGKIVVLDYSDKDFAIITHNPLVHDGKDIGVPDSIIYNGVAQ